MHTNAVESNHSGDLVIKIELDQQQNLVVNYYEQFPGFGVLVKSIPYDSGE